MSDATPADSKQEDRKFSPFAGCSIFIIAGVLAAGMIAFTVWTYFQMKDTITGFTEEKPRSELTIDVTGKESEQTALKSKLVGFRHNIEAEHQDEISLDAEEMNLAIGTFEILKPHRGALKIIAVRDDNIEADISFPVKPGIGSDEMRYINARLVIHPELVDGAVFPRVISVTTVEGQEVPEQFREFISETLLHPVRNDDEIGPIFKRLSAVEIEGKQLLLQTDPSYRAPSAPPEDRQPLIDRLMKGFAVVAVIFLAIVSGIIYLARRKKANEA